MEFHHNQDLKEFNRIYRECDSLYHEIALKIGLSDSAFSILYTVYEMGDGCLQRDICTSNSISKQTISSSIRKLIREDYLFLKPGKGRDMHIFLTEKGKRLTAETIIPVVEMENCILESMTSAENRLFIELNRKYLVLLRENVKNLQSRRLKAADEEVST